MLLIYQFFIELTWLHTLLCNAGCW